MTPYELGLHIIDHNERQKEDHQERVTLVYLAEKLHRDKRLPDLKKLLGQENMKKEQTQEEMLEQIKRLNAALGGSTF